MCGAAGRGQQGLGEQRQRREAGGHAWGNCYGNSLLAVSLHRGFCSTQQRSSWGKRAACRSPVPAVPWARHCCDNLASGALLLRQQPQGEWLEVFLSIFSSLLLLTRGTGGELCFADLFCLKPGVAEQAQSGRNQSPEPSHCTVEESKCCSCLPLVNQCKWLQPCQHLSRMPGSGLCHSPCTASLLFSRVSVLWWRADTLLSPLIQCESMLWGS